MNKKEKAFVELAFSKYIKAKQNAVTKASMTAVADFKFAEGYLRSLLDLFGLELKETSHMFYIVYADGSVFAKAPFLLS